MIDKIIFSEAADLIEKKGWIRRANKNKDGFCVIGAMLEVTDNNFALVRDYVFEFMRISNITCPLTLWNDSSERTKEEVIQALRKAAQ